jgi:hypothetical protein
MTMKYETEERCQRSFHNISARLYYHKWKARRFNYNHDDDNND